MANATLARDWDHLFAKELCAVDYKALEFPADVTNATRNTGGDILNKLAAFIPQLCGGSADLSPSTKTNLKGIAAFQRETRAGRNFHFGIREHAMGAIMNGMALHGPFIPYGSTFLVFSDYMRCPVRLSALMKLQCVYVFTHDSIYVGEDGPTHQPVEHAAALRVIPNLNVFRPADANETLYAWKAALDRRDGPTVILLSRQNLPTLDRTVFAAAENTTKGGYVLKDAEDADCILMANGSELAVLVAAAQIIEKKGKTVRVVSMPCFELFEAESDQYKESVLPRSLTKRYVLDAGIADGWHRYAGQEGKIHSYEDFGKSGPYKQLADRFGYTPEKVAEEVLAYIG